MEGHNLVGQSLSSRYKLIKLIGAGGMGAVYMGQDTQMSNRQVAVKVLAPHLVSDEKQIIRFEQEARAASKLRHPNSISVLDFGQSGNHIFMVLEYLTGETLTAELRRGRIEAWRALYMMRQICKSLAEAHSMGIIHRDLKPDNIFVCEIYGEKDFIKVIDFGIAKFLEAGVQELTQAGKMFGTPRYLSPEQAQGLPLAATSDLYALGVILFEMLCGRPPFVAEDPISVAIKHVQEMPPSFAEVAPDMALPDEVDRLVFKLLAKKPAARYQTAEEVIAAIDEALIVLTGSLHPTGGFAPVATRTPSKPVAAVQKRNTVPPPSLSDPADESTRAMDSVGPSTAQEPAPTMALDQVAHLAPKPAMSQEKTMALDTAAAAAMMGATEVARAPRPTTAHKGKAEQKDAGPSLRNLILLLILGVLAGAAVLAARLGGKDEPAALKPPPSPKSLVQAEPKADEPEQEGKAGASDKGAAGQAEPKIDEAKADEPTAHAAKPTAPAAAPPPATDYEVKLGTTPPGATVVMAGLELGKTPFPIKLREGQASQKIVLKLDGHEDYELETSKLLQAALAGAREANSDLKPKPKAAPKPAVKKPKSSDWM
jgi:serine/threonine protein kinase